MKRILFTIAIISSTGIFSQDLFDAMRYSRMQNLGTARFNAMGGSMGALGGEASAIFINPAAIGVYRNSEFTLSTALTLNDNESRFIGNTQLDGRFGFNIPNISFTQVYNGDPDSWKKYGFSIAHNRISNFHSDYTIQGNSNIPSSIIDDYVNDLNDFGANISDIEEFGFPFGPSQAYWHFLINPNPFTANLYERIDDLNNVSSIDKTKRIESRGNQSETNFSFGGNYRDKMYVGATIGIQTFRYEEQITYDELYNYQPIALPVDSLLDAYTERSELITTGLGVNFKLGMIYRINDAFRVGGAIHSPTFFGIREDFSFSSDARFTDGEFFTSDEVSNDFEYRLRTPSRFIGSLAYIHQQKASINVEYEYVNYANMRLDDKRDFETDFSSRNDEIDNTLEGTHNVRLGAEYRLDPLVLRAGIRYEDNPFRSNQGLDYDESRTTYSIGGGYRNKNFNFDVSYSLSSQSFIDNLYNSSPEFAEIDQNLHQLVFTIGWRY